MNTPPKSENSRLRYAFRWTSLQNAPLFVGLLLTCSNLHAIPVDSNQPVVDSSSVPRHSGVTAGWEGLDLRLPQEINWTSSTNKDRGVGRKACVAIGRDGHGPVELVVVEYNGFISATFLDGAGVRWKARCLAGQPLEFEVIPVRDAKTCGGAVEPSAKLQTQMDSYGFPPLPLGGNEGGLADCNDAPEVTVLVVYTSCAVFEVGGLGYLYSGVFLSEEVTNLAFDNSAISTDATTRHIKVAQILPTIQDYPTDCPPCVDPNDPGTLCGSDITFATDLEAVSNPTTFLGGPVRQMRDLYKADLVVMLRVSGTDGVAGLAYRKSNNDGNGTNAYCVVDVGTLYETVMTHELGHLFGCCHAPGDQGAYCTQTAQGGWNYSSGHRFVGDDNVLYGTIMAYPPATTISHFANPDIYFEGQPTGTTESTLNTYWSDNARTIRETFADVATYRCTPTPPPTPPGNKSGPVSCWGAGTTNSGISPNYGQSIVPGTLKKCIKVSAGLYFTVAIEEELDPITNKVTKYGAVKAWGLNSSNQTTVPSTLGFCTNISAGGAHVLAIKLDGTLAAWGSTASGQTTIPASIGICKEVAAGSSHSLAIRSGGTGDGLVVGWGSNGSGQTSIPPNLGTCSLISAGGAHSMALTTGGAVRCWGLNTSGQTNVPTTLGICTRIAAGDAFSVALKVDGTIKAWGAGTINTGVAPNYGQSIIPSDLNVCKEVSAGFFNSSSIYLESADGQVRLWGAGTTNTGISPNYGQSVVPSIPNPYIAFAISNGGYHTAIIRSAQSLTNCAGDFNNDGIRNGTDLTFLLSGWGTPSGDVNADGTTNGTDLTFLLSGWGPCQ